MKRAIITGASSGLGAAIFDHLSNITPQWQIANWSLDVGVDVRSDLSVEEAKLRWHKDNRGAKLDVLINCAGVNGLDFLPDVTEADWDLIMDTNAKGIFLVSRALVRGDVLKGGTILNIVSNASHVPMTSSIAYNASKGAAAIMTKQMSRELIKTHGITVFSISPNKLSGTGMSAQIDSEVIRTRGWDLAYVRAYQLAALPAGEETNPETLAEFIAFLLSSKERHKYLAGCDIPYGL